MRISSSLVVSALLCAGACCGLSSGAQAQNAGAEASDLGKKLQPYIACINRLSSRAMDSQERYLSWTDAKKGPTGKERIVYGLYTIYDTKDCEKGVAAAAGTAPKDEALEKAGSDYAAAAASLAPLLNEANDYYDQQNYKDDKMAKGRELHPKLIAAYDRFAAADKALRAQVEVLNDKVQVERLAAIEKAEGRSLRYLATDLMIKAKALSRAEAVEPKEFDLAKVNAAIDAFDQSIKQIETYKQANPDKRVGSLFVSNAKSFLTTAKELMRRVRDKTPYSTGDRMMLSNPGAGWMVAGSPPRLTRDYNQLVEAFNRGAEI